MQNVGSVFIGIFSQFLFAEIAVIIAVEKLKDSALIFDRFEGSLIEQENNGLLLAAPFRYDCSSGNFQWCRSQFGLFA